MRRRRSNLLAALALVVSCGAVVASCSDATAPEPATSLRASFAFDLAPQVTADDSTAKVTCYGTLTVMASGGGKAIVGALDLGWYFGRAQLPQAETETAASTLGSWLGSDTIVAGTSRTARLQFWAGIPFELKGMLHYTTAGSRPDSASVDIDCGRELGARVGGRPSVSGVAVGARDSLLVHGDTIDVALTAQAPNGLVETVVDLSGPVHKLVRYAETFSTSQAHTARFLLPAGADPTQPIRIRVTVTDALGDATAFDTLPAFRMVDRQLPTLAVKLWTDDDLATEDTTRAGWYAAGDTIAVFVESTDDNRDRVVRYSFGAPVAISDSLTGGSPVNTEVRGTLRVPVDPSWQGTASFTAEAFDQGGNSSGTRALPQAAQFYPAVARPIRRLTMPEPGAAVVALDPVRPVAYVTVPSGNGSLQVVSLATGTVDDSIVLPAPASGITTTLDGGSLIVALARRHTLAVYSTADLKQPARLLPLTQLADGRFQLREPQALADGSVVLALTGADSTQVAATDTIDVVDLATGADRLVGLGVGHVHVVGRTLAGTMAYLEGDGCAFTYSAGGGVGTCAAAWLAPGLFTTDSTGATLTLGRSVVDRRFLATRTFWLSNGTLRALAVTPAGTEAFAVGSHGISRVRVSDGVFVERILGSADAVLDAPTVTPNGQFLVLSRTTSTNLALAIVDLR